MAKQLTWRQKLALQAAQAKSALVRSLNKKGLDKGPQTRAVRSNKGAPKPTKGIGKGPSTRRIVNPAPKLKAYQLLTKRGKKMVNKYVSKRTARKKKRGF